jgi:signal transduction histidine kinase
VAVSVKRQRRRGPRLRYRGQDRRSRNAGLVPALDPARVVWMSLSVAVGAGAPALFFVPRGTSATTIDSYLLVASGLLCVVAGGTSLVSWRLTGRALQGWLSSALVVLGVLTLVSTGLSSFGLAPDRFVEALDGLVGAAIAGGMIWRGTAACEVDTGYRPFTTISGGIVLGVSALGVLNVARVDGLVPPGVEAPLPVAAVHLATSAVWIAVAAVAAAAATRPAGRRPRAPLWVFGVSALLGASPLAAAPSSAWAPTLAAAALMLAAGALALGAQVTRVQRVLTIDDGRQLRLHRALADSRKEVASEHADLEQRLHDARNALAGLQAADAVLRAGSCTGLAREEELADAVTAELARLQSLLDPTYRMQLVDLDVWQVLRPLVAAERALGARLDVEMSPNAGVRADAAALGRVLQNVLVNARRYAPGTEVVLRAAVRGPFVEISTRDAGPGIPAAERTVVFERGVRGAAAAAMPGNGLGLAACQGLLRAMGGEIRISTDGVPGCCVVILLPAAHGTAVPVGAIATALEPAGSALDPAV